MDDTIGNAPATPAKKPRKAPERGLTPAQIKTVAYLGRVGIATERGIQEANVSDRTPRTLETLERDEYIERVNVPGAIVREDDGVLVSISAFSLSRKGQAALSALRGLVG